MANKSTRKGYSGEMEALAILKNIIVKVAADNGLRMIDEVPVIERNRFQTESGGSDIKNPFGLAIEIKRCETLTIGVWWKQVCLAAKRSGTVPLLLYRQSRQQWRARTIVDTPQCGQLVVTMDEADFYLWFSGLVRSKLNLPVFVKLE